MPYIAHIREADDNKQTLEEHLLGVAEKSRKNADKLGMGDLGELIGLVHDVGKYKKIFQFFIMLPDARRDQDADGASNSLSCVPDQKKNLKGKIDHSTSGAQIVWRSLREGNPLLVLTAQMLSLSLASHHSGLIDSLAPDGEDNFTRRINKSDELTGLSEVEGKIPHEISARMDELFKKIRDENPLSTVVKAMREDEGNTSGTSDRFAFKMGLLLRMLFSCLIDADRTDTIDFEKTGTSRQRQHGEYAEWPALLKSLEVFIGDFGNDTPIAQWRAKISDYCRTAAERERGIFTLTVPTGGGKTLASLRFALRHAEKHKLDRIFYIVPYTSIIDQNAAVARKVLETREDEIGKIVLECHSNLSSERDSWRGKILSENWDAPIVFTTSVQFLEALFADGTRSVRKMHQFAKSVIIFDEIQTLPVRVVHMFCNAVNFLVERCGASAVLCTATQPLLNGVNQELGALNYSQKDEIVPDVSGVFESFRRTEYVYKHKPGGY
ncbi:MAG: CRISPR-associated endonuclease Cas3'', partial [Synergistaceae bacterium]|nr:CRISPR-associated endonuclease Cas3'' [Synergistaceae bacterium]